MRLSLLPLLLLISVVLLLFIYMTLHLFLPGTECVSTRYKQYENNILLLEEELKTLRHELKSAWEILGDTNERISLKELKKDNKMANKGVITDNTKDSIPTIVMITPTYARWTQKADLIRLCQTLMHVDNLMWIVVEDSINKTDIVKRLLVKCKVNYIHLNVRTAQDLQLEKKEPSWHKSRGVEQRNLALSWIRGNLHIPTMKSVVYFGDDDNTYDLELFNEIRRTQRVTVWPVGICGGLRWEGPICINNRVTEWHTAWAKKRPFPIDFAGFAINTDLILKFKNTTINAYSKIGWVESDFLSQIISPQEVHAGADNCMKVYVWHTRTEKPKSKDEEKLISHGQPSNPLIET